MKITTAVLMFITGLALASCAHIKSDSADYSLYILRHAEKAADGGRDPELSPEGIKRALRLATYFSDKRIETLYSSDYKRTRDTLEPLAKASRLDITLYNPRDLETTAQTLISAGQNAVVSGHSNTTPELAGLLGGVTLPPMPETEYDIMYRVDFHGETATVEAIDQRSLGKE